jgi:hypothetical protein
MSADPPKAPREPWRGFLSALDAALQGRLELCCFGGFVASQHYGVGRETADIDVLSAAHESPGDDIERLAGLGSPLHRRYRLYVQRVTIATPPADWAKRLAPMFPDAGWKRLRLFALDPIDLALSKLERAAERDRADLLALARAGLIDADTFHSRYVDEVRPYLLSREAWHDRTAADWTALIREVVEKPST